MRDIEPELIELIERIAEAMEAQAETIQRLLDIAERESASKPEH